MKFIFALFVVAVGFITLLLLRLFSLLLVLSPGNFALDLWLTDTSTLWRSSIILLFLRRIQLCTDMERLTRLSLKVLYGSLLPLTWVCRWSKRREVFARILPSIFLWIAETSTLTVLIVLKNLERSALLRRLSLTSSLQWEPTPLSVRCMTRMVRRFSAWGFMFLCNRIHPKTAVCKKTHNFIRISTLRIKIPASISFNTLFHQSQFTIQNPASHSSSISKNIEGIFFKISLRSSLSLFIICW